MRTLKRTIEPAADGRTVRSLLRQELACSDAHISRLKRREQGILLNGVRCYVTARVQTGDELQIEIGDCRTGTSCRWRFRWTCATRTRIC